VVHFFAGDCGADGEAATEADGAGDGCTVEAGEGVGVGVVCSGMPDCKTELVPLKAGNESVKAISMNAAAAPIVIFASKVCVPRGPKAVLETELENNAPASALPGCRSIVTTRMMHARMNNPYRM